jgi:uncharacterized protein YkwD
MTTTILISVLIAIIVFAIVAIRNAIKIKAAQQPKPIIVYPNYTMTAYEFRLIQLINEYRINNGLGILYSLSTLANVSYSHSVWLAENIKSTDQFDIDGHHNKQQRFDYFKPKRVGENNAMGYIHPESVVAGWKNSPSHNANLLMPYFNSVGLSHCKSVSGVDFVCCMFCS